MIGLEAKKFTMIADNMISLMVALTLTSQASTLRYIHPIPLTLHKTERQIKIPKQPTNSVNFSPGMTIKPSNILLDWLNNQVNITSGKRKRLRLPVVVSFRDSYRLAISNTFIGTSAADINKDAIALSLDDSSMGISLLERLRHICPKNSNSCNVWLEGYWGSRIELDISDSSFPRENEGESTKWPFTVLKVHELIKQPNQGEEIKVFIESSSP